MSGMPRLHAGHSKSDQTTTWTGASAGPRAGESAALTAFTFGPNRTPYAPCACVALRPPRILSASSRAPGRHAGHGRDSRTHWASDTA